MGDYKGGALGALTHEPKFKQDVKTRSKHSGEDVINNMSSLMNQNLNRTQNHEAITAARTQYMAWVV
jgi:hypothetical protein